VTTREDNFTSTPDAAAAYAAKRAQNARTTERHAHAYSRSGRVRACYCGEVVDEGDAS
jgi:hypothetical protein